MAFWSASPLASTCAFCRARMNANARPKITRKATPTAIAMPDLAPIDRESELSGVTVELGLEVWLIAAEVVVVEDEVNEVDEDEVKVVDVEVEIVVGAELAVGEWAMNVPVSALGAG